MQIQKIDTRASMHALIVLLEGRRESARNTAFYRAYIGFDPALMLAACESTISLGRDAIMAIFDPADVAGGPTHIGVGFDLGGLAQLQFGRLWMAPGADCAMVVPRGVGKRYGHFACEDGRFVRRASWPAKDLAPGTERAEARLAELTIEFALTPA